MNRITVSGLIPRRISKAESLDSRPRRDDMTSEDQCCNNDPLMGGKS